jgi:hypothetical protein
MNITLQFSVFSHKGYKPLSTLLEVNYEDYLKDKQKFKSQAVFNICAKRHMTFKDLKKYGYEELRVRYYDPEKIEQEKQERYEQIKKERGWT